MVLQTKVNNLKNVFQLNTGYILRLLSVRNGPPLAGLVARIVGGA